MALGDGDLETIFETLADFSVDVTFDLTPTDLVIKGIFNEPSDPTEIYGVAIEAVKPSVTVQTADLTSAIRKDVPVTISGRSFTVVDLNKTGPAGMTDIILKTA